MRWKFKKELSKIYFATKSKNRQKSLRHEEDGLSLKSHKITTKYPRLSRIPVNPSEKELVTRRNAEDHHHSPLMFALPIISPPVEIGGEFQPNCFGKQWIYRSKYNLVQGESGLEKLL